MSPKVYKWGFWLALALAAFLFWRVNDLVDQVNLLQSANRQN